MGFLRSASRRRALPVWAAGAMALVAAAPMAARSQGLAPRFQRGAQAEPLKRVTVSLATSKVVARPGDQLAVAVVFEFLPKWHAWPNEPVVPDELPISAIPTTATLSAVATGGVAGEPGETPGWLQAGPVQWPDPHAVEVDYGFGEMELLVYEGRSIAYLPLILSQDAPVGEHTLTMRVGYQACDDRVCEMPQNETHTVSFKVTQDAEEAAAGSRDVDASLFKGFDASVFAKMLEGTLPADGEDKAGVEFNAFGIAFTLTAGGALGLAALLAVAALGGFLLNLTPCVLPVIPIKIMGISQSAGNPARALYLGLVMSLGVVGFWMAIGAAIGFVSGFDSISALFQTPWFSLVVGALILVMGVGMLGVFTVRLPKAVYMVNPGHDTTHGAFLFGVMTAVLSTPCTAPFMGTAAAWAAKQSPGVTLATFGSIGFGMALPYLVLSAFPKLVSKVPRTGPASELVKQVMGLLMFAVAVFFIGTGLTALLTEPGHTPTSGYWWGVGALVVVAMAWMAKRTFAITTCAWRRSLYGAIALGLASLGGWSGWYMTRPGPIDWVVYSPELLEEANARGDVVVVDFTANWCLNCKALEMAVLNTPEISSLLREDGVTPMKVDLTNADPAGQALLSELERVAIPLLAVFGPGVDEPIRYDSYTVTMVKAAVEEARGGQTAMRAGAQ